MIRHILTLLTTICVLAVPAPAQDLSVLAHLDPARTRISQAGQDLKITLGIDQPVPFRAFLLDHPRRLVVDFREVDFGAADLRVHLGPESIQDLRWGPVRPGWSRMVAELSGPMAIARAVEKTGDKPAIILELKPVAVSKFTAHAGAADNALRDRPQPAPVAMPHTRQDGTNPLQVVLDPGHGGIDPGARNAGQHEADIVLIFARQLRDVMRRAGMQVVMTRDRDMFVPLETRVTLARAAGADLFISLHADSLAWGNATGATIYRLADTSEDEATRKLVDRHDRDDLLAGVDLDGQGDQVAHILVELARRETQPRSVRLAQVLAGSIRTAGLRLYKHPVQGANFSVLKSPDIPSVLIELGFLSSRTDRQRLNDPAWRARMASAIVQGVQNWARQDAAEARLLRQ